MILGGRARTVTAAHRAPHPTDLACPVCHAAAGDMCRGVDYLTLPSVHGERTEVTPLFDELARSL